MRKDFIHINDKNNPFLKDENFDVCMMETYTEGSNHHIIDNIDRFFKNDKIIISYTSDKIILALAVFLKTISDIHLKYNEIIVNNKEFWIPNDIIENDTYINIDLNHLKKFLIIEEIYKSNEIIIKCRTHEDYEYSKTVVIYTTNSIYEDTYNLNKELDRWNSIK